MNSRFDRHVGNCRTSVDGFGEVAYGGFDLEVVESGGSQIWSIWLPTVAVRSVATINVIRALLSAVTPGGWERSIVGTACP